MCYLCHSPMLMIGIAIWLLDRIIPHSITMVLISGLIIYIAIYLGALRKSKKNNLAVFIRTIAILSFIYGISLFLNVLVSGNEKIVSPISFRYEQPTNQPPFFLSIENKKDLSQILNIAHTQHKIILLDFYADWCENCKKFDRDVLANSNVKALLSKFVMGRVDLTNINSEAVSLAKQFSILAPPAIIFLDENGNRFNIPVIIDSNPDDFINILQHTLTSTLISKNSDYSTSPRVSKNPRVARYI